MSKVPEFLYRAFKEKKYADDFVNQGLIRLGGFHAYREMEDENRGDKDECMATYTKNVNGHLCTIGRINVMAAYLLCTSKPKVDVQYLKEKLGEYIVKITDPEQLLKSFKASCPINGNVQLTGFCELHPVEYTKGAEKDIDPDSNDDDLLSFTQKAPKYKLEYEYRYIIKARMLDRESFNHAKAHPYIEYDLGDMSEIVEKLY